MTDTGKALDAVMKVAKKNLETDGKIMPVALFFKDDHMIGVLPSTSVPTEPDDDEHRCKHKHMFASGLLARGVGADLVVTVYDAAMKSYDKGPPENYDPVTDAPLTYPKSMRTECIILSAMPFPADREPEVTRVETYKGGDGEPVEWLGPLDLGKEGHFENNLSVTAYKGWDKGTELVA